MDHTVGQSPSWLKHGHWQIRPYAIHLPSGPCRFSPTFRTSQGNGIAVAGCWWGMHSISLPHIFSILQVQPDLFYHPSFETCLCFFFGNIQVRRASLDRTSLALRDYWRVKLGTSNRSGIAELELVQAIYGTMFHWMIGTWAHGVFPMGFFEKVAFLP